MFFSLGALFFFTRKQHTTLDRFPRSLSFSLQLLHGLYRMNKKQKQKKTRKEKGEVGDFVLARVLGACAENRAVRFFIQFFFS